MKSDDKCWLYIIIAATLALHLISLYTMVGTFSWIITCMLAAYMNSVCGGYGHNALHQLHPIAILLDWNGLSCYEWLFEHIQSHHMYVNTKHDHDSISMEPFLQWIPDRPSSWFGTFAPYAKHALYLVAEIAVAIQGNFVHKARWKASYDSQLPLWMRLAPFVFVIRVGSYFITQGVAGITTALLTIILAGYFFAYLAHLNHGFDGDGRPDFLLHQLKNTKDIRTEAHCYF